MIRDDLNKYLSDRGFNKVALNVESMDLFYLKRNADVSLIWIVEGVGITQEAYQNSFKKIKNNFSDKGLNVTGTITLFLSNSPKEAMDIAGDTPFWVIDAQYGRIVIYENQPEDFEAIRLPLEKMVSMFAADRIRIAGEEYANRERKAQEKQTAAQERAAKKYFSSQNTRVVRFKPWVTYTLILINVLMCVLQELILPADMSAEMTNWGADSSIRVFEHYEFYRLVTSMFMHAGFGHLVSNMFMLYATGEMLEAHLGKVRFILLYFLGGIFAGLGSCYYYYNVEPYSVSVGASGAIMALIAAFAYMLFLNRNRIGGDVKFRIVLFLIYILYNTVGQFNEEGIDNAAHITGLFAGLVIYGAMYFLRRKKKG